MEPERIVNEEEVQEKAPTFGGHIMSSVVRNLVLKTALWGIIFALAGLLYAKMIFQGEWMPEPLGALGSVAALGVYLPGGIIAGLCFGAFATINDAAGQIYSIIDTGVSMTFVKFLPGDRETVSVEEVRRILDSVAPGDVGLSGLPIKLVRKRVESDLLGRAAAGGSHALKVAGIKDYVTDRLAGAAVRDIRLKAFIGRVAGWLLVFVFLVLPLLLVALF